MLANAFQIGGDDLKFQAGAAGIEDQNVHVDSFRLAVAAGKSIPDAAWRRRPWPGLARNFSL
jgi:hypothetical protein